MTKLNPVIIDFKAKEVLSISNMLSKAKASKEFIDDEDIRDDVRVLLDNASYLNSLLKSYTPEQIAASCERAGYSSDVKQALEGVTILNELGF